MTEVITVVHCCKAQGVSIMDSPLLNFCMDIISFYMQRHGFHIKALY